MEFSEERCPVLFLGQKTRTGTPRYRIVWRIFHRGEAERAWTARGQGQTGGVISVSIPDGRECQQCTPAGQGVLAQVKRGGIPWERKPSLLQCVGVLRVEEVSGPVSWEI